LIELKEFQRQAAEQIVDRFESYYEDPPKRGREKSLRAVPFFQALASITASGKTVVLAEAVSSISTLLPIAPVVLWLSKGKVVVEQSYANLAHGGRYHHLLAPARVSTLAQYDAQDVAESDQPLVFFATVGTFNQKDKEKGDRLLFKSDIDTAESSTWNALKARPTKDGIRRPLLVVYDEGHNLSDQQTDLLLELQPDGLIVASATMRRPARIVNELNQLKAEGWTEDDLVTVVDPKAVADSGLVKNTVLLGGYEAPMEETVNALIADFVATQKDAEAVGIGPLKAIYVSKTNIVEGNSLQRDDPKQPFKHRKAPPILIWRHLTEKCAVDPEHIAVYCSLKFDKNHPPPDDFRLFSGGDKDYEEFVSGPFRHVIFNLSLQEGWDDPLCYFAYIDKSMESNVAVEQVIGRLLRQPGGQHYASEPLNSAHFYVRVDKRGVFNALLDDVGRKLGSEAPAVRLIETSPGKPTPVALPPKQTRTVFETGYDTEAAVKPIAELVEALTDYRTDDGINTRSAGGRALIQHVIGDPTIATTFEWKEFEHANMVSARWLFHREVARLFQGALGLARTDSPKFDALVGFGSRAHKQIVTTAHQVVETYIDNVDLKQRRPNPYTVGSVLVRMEELESFNNALHDGYSGLNSLELTFARALDRTGLPWFRNPSRSGYAVPLISVGTTRNFYPDFLVWKGDDVIAVDTTGGHLLQEKTGRKLLSVIPPKNAAGRLVIRFISEGSYNADIDRQDKAGYTVWGLKQDGTLRATVVESADEAVERAVS